MGHSSGGDEWNPKSFDPSCSFHYLAGLHIVSYECLKDNVQHQTQCISFNNECLF